MAAAMPRRGAMECGARKPWAGKGARRGQNIDQPDLIAVRGVADARRAAAKTACRGGGCRQGTAGAGEHLPLPCLLPTVQGGRLGLRVQGSHATLRGVSPVKRRVLGKVHGEKRT